MRSGAFQGYHGEQANGCFAGIRDDGCCIRLSGGVAAQHWRSVYATATNVSRLDLAVTVELDAPVPNLAFEARQAVRDYPKQGTRPQTITLMEKDAGGSTLYLGSRSSDAMVRVYDYGARHKTADVGMCWRWELEYKRRLANWAAGRVATAGNRPRAIGSIVAQRCSKAGLPTLWQATDSFSEEKIHTAYDDDRALDWLTTQVAPSVQRLREGGRLLEALACLGLADVADVVRKALLPSYTDA